MTRCHVVVRGLRRIVLPGLLAAMVAGCGCGGGYEGPHGGIHLARCWIW